MLVSFFLFTSRLLMSELTEPTQPKLYQTIGPRRSKTHDFDADYEAGVFHLSASRTNLS